MAVIRWAGFAGENRAIHPRLLAENLGTLSQNQKPGRGDLRPWKLPTQVASVPAGSKTIYRMGRDVASDANYWLSWPTVVHAVRGFDVDDTTERTYFTGSGAPKVTSNTMALASLPYPTTSRSMGLPAPATPPTAQADAGTWTGLRRNVAAARTESDGLRDAIYAFRAKLPNATAATVAVAADTAAELLGACAAEYQDVAAASDGHAADARTLVEAWPVTGAADARHQD